MKVLAIIPARAGSKRVPGKNTKILAGLPLIAHTIIAAKEAACCHTILVSTECETIAKIGLQYGAVVPWLRSADLADDLSDVVDSVIQVIERFEQQGLVFDSVLLLQPTSPFRSALSIIQAIELHKKTKNSVVSVSLSTIKPAWFKSVDEQGNLNACKTVVDQVVAPELSTLYQLNGSIYLASVEQLRHYRNFYSTPTKALIIQDAYETIDIDTPLDWRLAETIVESNERYNSLNKEVP